MEWRDQGALLSVRAHGESAAIIEVFTAGHGRHAGVVRGGGSRKMSAILQPGAQVEVTWRARLDAHIGTFTVEPLQSRTGVLGDRIGLAGLSAVLALLAFVLPEREAHPPLYARSIRLLDRLGESGWPVDYLQWELVLLEEMGFGLDLTRCAATGTRDDLVYVSPRTGRAVSRSGAGDWAGRLLPLPACMLGQSDHVPGEVAEGLRTTGHFMALLARELGDRPLPAARQRLLDLLARS